MRMTKLTAYGLALLFSVVSSGAWAAQKVAFVEVPRLLQEAPQVDAIRGQLKREFSRRDDELVAQQKQLASLEEKLQRDASIMSDGELKRLERDVISRRRKLKSDQTAFQEDLALRQNEELNKLRKVISEVVIDIAKRDDFDLVLESGVVWASDSANITGQVLQALRDR